MSQKLQKQGFWKLKPVLHTMQVLKFGKTNLMITKVIYGPWDAFFTNLWLWIPHSLRRIWKAFTKELWRVYIQKFPLITLLIYPLFLVSFYKLIQKKDLLVNNFYTCQSLWQSIMSLNFKSKVNQLTVPVHIIKHLKCSVLSKYL